MNSNKNPEYLLQKKLVTCLENLIHDQDAFNEKFTRLLKKLDSKNDLQISKDSYPLLLNHIHETLETAVKLLKKKSLHQDTPEKVYRLIFTLIEAHSWITELPDTNKELRSLADDCLGHLVKDVSLRPKSGARK